MGKAQRQKKQMRHDPLAIEIKESEETGRLRKPRPWKQKNDDDMEDDEMEQPMTEQMSKRVLKQVREQQAELAEDAKASKQLASAEARQARFFEINKVEVDSDDDDIDDYQGEDEEIELSVEDEAALAMFMPSSSASGSRNLADIIMDKIREQENSQSQSMEEKDADEGIRSRLDPKVIEVYTGVGQYLRHYSSGKIPKAFKIIPNLKNWEEIVYLTNADSWSAQAMFAAVRLFSSNLSPKMAQRFYNIILLPRVRLDIEEHQRLNYHLYQSLIKCIYKPSAFFKGILLPLADEGCTPREAVVISSVLSRATIPVPHSAVALLKLSQLEYSGPTLLFMKTLLNKKYSLPYKVVDAMVKYFVKFAQDSRQMPVCWHQALLTFVQRYKHSLKPSHKTPLNRLLSAQNHGAITLEIRRELNAQMPLNLQQRARLEQRQQQLSRMQTS